MSLVSDVKGTTTDPVKKAMELLPLGPVVIVDTPGIDDEGALGEMRVKKTKQVLNYIDIAVLVVDSTVGLQDFDREMLTLLDKKTIPFVVAYIAYFWRQMDKKSLTKEDLEKGEKY